MAEIIVITGASGVGKTTLVNNLKERLKHTAIQFYHFDSIGIPSFEEMVAEYGSTEKWQEEKTEEWIEKLIGLANKDRIIFEGSTSIEFIKQGFSKYGIENYRIVLLDCSEEEMNQRLRIQRNQAELVNEQMSNWLVYLRNQAKKHGLTVLDSSKFSAEELTRSFIQTFINPA